MFCVHCGKEIPDDSQFCPNCGGKQPIGITGDSKIGDMISQAGDKIGNGIDEAVNDFHNEVKGFGQTISQKVDVVENRADEAKQNWKDYLTLENMEILAVLVLVLPLFMWVVNYALTFVAFKVIYGIFRTRFILNILRFITGLIRVIFVAVSGAGIAAVTYILVKEPSKRNVWSYVTAGGAVLSFLACFGIMRGTRGWLPFIYVFGLACLIWGIDAISRVLLQRKGFESQANPGEDIAAYKKWYADYKLSHPSSKEVEAKEIQSNPEASYFDGDGLSLLGLYILTFIVSLITCGIAAPWMICKAYKWRINHTVINGKRLQFTGTGGSLIGHWILWEILCIITCGIYSFFMHVALRKWEMQHTVYDDQPYWQGQFDGNSFQYFGYGLLQTLLLLVTCGLAAPWTITMIQKWEMKHSIIAKDRLRYDGTAMGLLGQYIVVFLLTIITCGLYSPWATVRINKYVYRNTHVDSQV